MSLIECRAISVAYENKCIISNLTFSVNEGDYICIVGENGSGKSTLIKTILSLKEIIKGELILGEGLRRNEIGYLPQQTSIQRDFPANVLEIVLSGFMNKRKLTPFYSQKDKISADKNITRLGISDLKKRSYNELSGGQQQRVLLARALCATRKLLILDEPVSGLDPNVTQDMYQLIQAINKDGITIIMVSHDMRGTMKHASHILHLSNEGDFFGTVQEYRETKLFENFLSD